MRKTLITMCRRTRPGGACGNGTTTEEDEASGKSESPRAPGALVFTSRLVPSSMRSPAGVSGASGRPMQSQRPDRSPTEGRGWARRAVIADSISPSEPRASRGRFSPAFIEQWLAGIAAPG